MKKIISMLLAILMFIPYSVFAEEKTQHEITLNKLVYNNANYDGENIGIKADGFMSGECYVPFESAVVTVEYTASADATLVFVFDDDTKNSVTLSAPKSILTATSSLYQTMQAGIHTLKISADCDVTISNIIMNKADTEYGWGGIVDVQYTDDEKVLQNATIIRTDSQITLVRNALRYVNPKKYNHKPFVNDGITYLPADYFMEMLNLYCEKDEQNSTVLLRENNTEMYFDANGCKITKDGTVTQLSANLERNRCTLCLPLRLVAETYGKTVDYKDGLIVIDDAYDINNILNNEKLVQRVKNKLASNETEGRILHVSQNNPNANDTNSGSEDMPFKTINAATAVAAAGDKLIVHQGTYRETVTFANNGTAASPIILEGADEEDVTISANEKISKLISYQNGTYLASISAPLADNKNMIFYNGEPLSEARHPNAKTNDNRSDLSWLNLSDLWGVQGDIAVTDNTKAYELTSEKCLNQTEENYWSGAYFIGLVHEGWRRSMGKIKSSQFGKITLDPATVSYGYWGSSSTILNTDFGYIVGSINALDTPGEWVIKDKTLHIIPPVGADVTNDTFEYKKRMLLIDLTGKSNIQIKNMKGIGGSINMKDATLCALNGCDFKYISHFTWVADTRDGFIDNATDYTENGAQAKGEVGFYIGGANNIIYNCKIDYSAGAGLFIAGKYAYVYNNEISNSCYDGLGIGGIYFGYEPWGTPGTPRGGHAAYFNSVYNCGRAALMINSMGNWISQNGRYTRYIPFDVAYNDFYNGGILGGRDGGVLNSWCTSLGDDEHKSKIHNNVVWDYYAYDNGHSLNVGIYYDDCTQQLESYGNVIFYTNEEAKLKLLFFNHQEMTNKSINTGLYNYDSVEFGYLPEGKEGLTYDDYPNGKYFRSGSSLSKLGRLKPQETISKRSEAKNAVLSNGMKLVSDTAYPSKSGDYIKFENVDFGDLSNSIEFYFKGNCFGLKDRLELRLDSPDGTLLTTKSVLSKAPRTDEIDRCTVETLKTTGMHDVYLCFAKAVSVGIVSIRPFYEEREESNTNDLVIKCESFAESGKLKETTNSPILAKTEGIKGTWDGNYVYYENCNATSDFSKVSVVFGTKPPYSGNIMKIYADSLESTPLATIVLEAYDWNTKSVIEAELNTALSMGMHEIYFAFEGEGACSDVYTVTFSN